MLYGTQSVMQQQLMNGRSTFNGYDRNAIAALFYDKSKANFAVYSVINYCADAIADTLRRAKIIDKDGNEVTNHWSYDVFFNPNKFMQPKDFYYAYAVNRLLFGDAEQARFRIAILRARCDRADFDEAKAHVGEYVDVFAIFVQTGSQSDAIRKGQAHELIRL